MVTAVYVSLGTGSLVGNRANSGGMGWGGGGGIGERSQ